MAYQETKTTGYGTRLSNSLRGIGTGFLMLLGGTVLLWWNEGRAVKTTQMLEEAQGVAVHVDDVSNADPSLNGKLIHATAFTQTKDSLCDATFDSTLVKSSVLISGTPGMSSSDTFLRCIRIYAYFLS